MNSVRLWLAVLGLLAGLALHALSEVVETWEAGLWAFALAFAVVAPLATALLTGSLGLIGAVKRGVMLALPLSVLVYWSISRFGGHEPFSYAFAIIAALLAVPLLADARIPPVPSALFAQTQRIVAQGLAALVTQGLFWIAFWVSALLLELVGLDFLADLADEQVFVFATTGLVLGLGLAIASEQDALERLSDVLLRILRVLVPPILVIIVVFIAGVLIGGLDQVFGKLSATVTLLSMAAGAALLVISVVDREDGTASRNVWLVRCARALSLVLPVLTLLAVYAIWLRVDQYGWTPERVAGAVFAAAGFLVTVCHALASSLGGSGWMEWHRSATRTGWLVCFGLAVLCLTPVVDGYRISANSQILRFMNAESSVDDLDLVAMAKRWGAKGQAAFDRLKSVEDHAEQTALTEAIALAEEGLSRSQRKVDLDELFAEIPVFPSGANRIDVSEIKDKDRIAYLARQIARACSKMPPRCAKVVGDFDMRRSGDEAVVLFEVEQAVRAIYFLGDESGEGLVTRPIVYFNSEDLRWEDVKASLARGDIELEVPRHRVLSLGGKRITPVIDR